MMAPWRVGAVPIGKTHVGRMPADNLCIYLILCDRYGVLGSQSFSALSFRLIKKQAERRKSKMNREWQLGGVAM